MPLPAGSTVTLAADLTAIEVAVSVLHFLQSVPWLAKDIIWIVPDVSCGALSVTHVSLLSFHKIFLSEYTVLDACTRWQC